jgi:putative peptidoglycan lipid II flippase
MVSESSVLKAAKSFFMGTLFSRLMGMLRDVSMAFCFGSAPEVAAFMVAYRLANLFRRLFGEGSLQGGFVPHFERLRGQGETNAALFYRDLFYSLLTVLAGTIVIGSLICWALAWLFDSDIPLMTLAMMPGVAFLCLYALDSSVHQCWNRFFLPAFAPVIFNLVWIVSALFLQGAALRTAMFTLSFCLMGAFFLQWMAVSWNVSGWLRSVLGRQRLRPQIFSKEVRALFKPLAFGLVGLGAAQINSAFDAIFARLADPSGPAYLWYAIRIQQLPLALFGIALSGAMLPALSRATGERYGELLRSSLKKSAALMVPCAVGMWVLAHQGLDLLYGRGGFLDGDVVQTGLCLGGYALGLVPMVYVLLLANGFYAQKEYAWPMRCSLISVGCNLFLNTLFVFGFAWGAESVAIATSFSSLLNCVLLQRGMRAYVADLSLWRGMGRIGVCSLVAGMAVWAFDGLIVHQRVFVSQLLRFAGCGGVYALSVLGMSFLMKEKDLLELIGMKKAPRKSGAS